MRLYIFAACALLVAAACVDAFGNKRGFGYFKDKFGSSNSKFGSFKNLFGSFKSKSGPFDVEKHTKTFSGFIRNILTNINELFGKDKKSEGPKERPDFCGERECPTFTVENKTDFYELRCYPSLYWVSTKDYGYPTPMGSTSRRMFMKLYGYISGQNSEKANIEMTVPVLVGIKGDGEQKKQKMSFYIPKKYQKTPPKPTDPSVVVKSSKFCAYVHSFDGLALLYSTIEKQVKMLKKRLEQDGLGDTYVADVVMTAGYDRPDKLTERHNEVMLLKK